MKAKGIDIRTWLIMLVCLLAVVPTVWVLIIRLEGQAPTVQSGLEADAAVGAREVVFRFSDVKSGLRRVRIDLLKDGKETVLYQEDFPSAGFPGGGLVREKSVAVQIPPANQKLGDGKGVVRLYVSDYSWRGWFHGNQTVLETHITIDRTVPRIEILSQAHNVNQGGAGVVIYKLSESCANTGVHVDEEFFPGYSGYFQDPLIYMAFFALSHDQGRGTQLSLTASDVAGNSGRAGFYHHIRKKSFRKDKIVLSDGFLEGKMPDFERFFPSETGAEPIKLFLKVNRDLRRDNYRTVTELVRVTDRTIHWEGPFLRLPNAARRAGFADNRDYYYNEEPIDQQVHLGIDLASLTHSAVQAANAGRIAFADDLGIYGQTVVIDHGFGLFSMYAHLSSISVASGQHVARGVEIGRTGSTGLAGGDHLHFSMMVGHVFVNPIEWWDGAWIKNNVTDKIVQASQAAPPAKTAAAGN